MSTEKEKPKANYDSKLGPIPPDNWDNDLPYNPNTDTSPGSLADYAKGLIEKAKPPKK